MVREGWQKILRIMVEHYIEGLPTEESKLLLEQDEECEGGGGNARY